MFDDIILHHDEGVDLIPSNISLSEFEPRLAGVFMREKILANGIEAVKDDYDYVLIDCSHTLGILTINAIVAADPLQTIMVYFPFFTDFRYFFIAQFHKNTPPKLCSAFGEHFFHDRVFLSPPSSEFFRYSFLSSEMRQLSMYFRID